MPRSEMDLSDVQPKKISLPREARRSPPSSVTLPSAEQPANALLPMETSPAGRSNCVSDEQPAKALSPIAEQVAPSANVTDESAVQPAKAFSPITSTGPWKAMPSSCVMRRKAAGATVEA